MDNLSSWGAESIKGWKKQASAIQTQKSVETSDLKLRAKLQNKLADLCEDMCKEVGAYPKCNECPAFVAPDATPGVMTWEELLTHMDNLSSWGAESIKGWKKQASAIQTTKVSASSDLERRALFQNKLASICEDMCKEVGAYPKCNECP